MGIEPDGIYHDPTAGRSTDYYNFECSETLINCGFKSGLDFGVCVTYQMGEELKDELGCTLGDWKIIAITGERLELDLCAHTGLGIPLQNHPIEHQVLQRRLNSNPPESDLEV